MKQIEVQPAPDYEPNNWFVYEEGSIVSEHKKKSAAKRAAKRLFDPELDTMIVKYANGSTQEVKGQENDPKGGRGLF